MKKFKQIFAGALLGLSLLAPEAKSGEFSWYRNAWFGASYESPVIEKADKIPEQARTSVRDLGQSIERRTIKEDSVGFYPRGSMLKSRFGIEYSGDNASLRAGAGLEWNFDWCCNLNYYSKRRDSNTRAAFESDPSDSVTPKNLDKCESPGGGGYDENVQFYYLHPSFWPNWNTCLKPSLFSELEIKTGEKTSVIAGCELWREKIISRNGFNLSSEEVTDKYKLADICVAKPYIGFKFLLEKTKNERDYLFIEAGLNKAINKKFSDLGQETEFTFNKFSGYIGIGTVIEFN